MEERVLEEMPRLEVARDEGEVEAGGGRRSTDSQQEVSAAQAELELLVAGGGSL